VLYGLFFFASCAAYVRYLRTSRLRWLAGSFALFALSCLSKGTAVTLPVVLLLLDWLHHRRPSAGLVVEKLPFVALALWIGWVAVRLQATVPMADFVVFTPAQRLALAAYGFVRYCEKLFVPFRLSAFYPYPQLDAAHHLPRIYAALPALALLVAALPLWLAARRGHRPGTLRLAAFGVAFFTITIALVLQFVSFGTALMADRYTYVPYAGPLLLLGYAATTGTSARARPIVVVAVVAYSAMLALGCYHRTAVWTNSETLWTDVIQKYPFRFVEEPGGSRVVQHGVTTAYENRGNWYREHGDVTRAVRDYEVLVAANVDESGPYVNMGNIHGARGDELLRQGHADQAAVEYAQALDMYSRAIERGGNSFETHLNRAITYAAMGDHDRALADFRAALELNPQATRVRVNVAYEELQTGRWDECIADATAAIAATPSDASAHLVRGVAHVRSGRPAEGRADLERAVSLDPGLGSAWYELSRLYVEAGDRSAALDAARRARAAGQPVPETYLDGLARGG
jgi:tetratricopeptide (TPR) repeat protein